MHSSTITAKGQTTIPIEIREYLDLVPHDKLVYVPDGDKVYLMHVHGTIFDIKGALKHKVNAPINFEKLREQVKQKVSKEILS